MSNNPMTTMNKRATNAAELPEVTVLCKVGKTEAKFAPIDLNYRGVIPKGYELVEVTNDDLEDCTVLYGFDEIAPRPGVHYGFLRFKG